MLSWHAALSLPTGQNRFRNAAVRRKHFQPFLPHFLVGLLYVSNFVSAQHLIRSVHMALHSFRCSGSGLWTHTSWRCQRKMCVRLGASIQWNDFAWLFMCQENCSLADCRGTLSKHMTKKAQRLEDVGMGRKMRGTDQCLWQDLAQVGLILRFDWGSRIE